VVPRIAGQLIQRSRDYASSNRHGAAPTADRNNADEVEDVVVVERGHRVDFTQEVVAYLKQIVVFEHLDGDQSALVGRRYRQSTCTR